MISFDQKIKDLWSEHAKNTEQVIQSFDEVLQMTQSSDQLKKVIHLANHVYTDHKIDNSAALNLFGRLEASSFNNAETRESIANSQNIFKTIENPDYKISDLPVSQQVKISAGAAAAFSFLKKFDKASELIGKAVTLAQTLPQQDSAFRSLAITGNNMACSLEEKTERSQTESELMILAAKTAREFWEKAGTWVEVERAEYRLAQSYLKLRDFINSIKHANLCITICEKNSAPPLEFFYAYEAVAHIEKTIGQPLRSLEKMKHYFNLLSEDDKKWCSSALEFFMK
ncbi:MAG: hypothetical protein ACXWQQ_07055 [Pseudobdellovibrio sp.]